VKKGSPEKTYLLSEKISLPQRTWPLPRRYVREGPRKNAGEGFLRERIRPQKRGSLREKKIFVSRNGLLGDRPSPMSFLKKEPHRDKLGVRDRVGGENNKRWFREKEIAPRPPKKRGKRENKH